MPQGGGHWALYMLPATPERGARAEGAPTGTAPLSPGAPPRENEAVIETKQSEGGARARYL